MLQAKRSHVTAASQRRSSTVERITVFNNTFMRGGKEVLPLGANYVFKAHPYFPDVDVVRQNARAFAMQAKHTTFTPTNGREIVPVVRLGCMLEGAMPLEPGQIDEEYMNNLKSTVQAFAEEGVYVFLDNHNDAFAGTNGGQGMPVWMTVKMQETDQSKHYITTPDRPLELVIPAILRRLINSFGAAIPKVVIADHKDPWLNYSYGSNVGDPRLMAIGNVNMRVNNCDSAWGKGTISMSKQMQNACYRFFLSYGDANDKAAFFDPYMHFIKLLAQVWEENTNVIAVELFNEPPICGLPDISEAWSSRNNLFKFYQAVLDELEAAGTRAPIAFQDIGGSVLGAGAVITTMEAANPIPGDVIDTLKAWSAKDQLILSVHYYENIYDQSSFSEFLKHARNNGEYLGTPLWLSEYWMQFANTTSQYMVDAVENGMDSVTYWHFADLQLTGTQGWYKYPEEVLEKGIPVDGDGNVNWEAWARYEPTVRDFTFWGANINGAEGAKEILGLPLNYTALASFRLPPLPGTPPETVFGMRSLDVHSRAEACSASGVPAEVVEATVGVAPPH